MIIMSCLVFYRLFASKKHFGHLFEQDEYYLHFFANAKRTAAYNSHKQDWILVNRNLIELLRIESNTGYL